MLSTIAFIVFDLSEADIPDVTPEPFKSTETVNAVSIGSVLLLTIGYKFNFLDLFSVIGVHMSPLACLAIKFINSGVTRSAAQIKSPSFSLFSSSTTIIILPCLTSSIASEMLSNFILLILFL